MPGDKKWFALGVELEGGYVRDQKALALRYPGARAKGDGSVDVEYDDLRPGFQCPPGRNEDYFAGGRETTTPAVEDLPTLLAMVEDLYPDAVNKSCGMHVHCSFSDDRYYRRLASTKFHAYFLGRWEAWGHANESRMLKDDSHSFWRRWRGENTYCKRNASAEKDYVGNVWRATHGGGDRYCQLNYCKSKFNTLECRMLPMFRDISLALDAIRELVDIYESWLAKPSSEDARASIFGVKKPPPDNSGLHPKRLGNTVSRKAPGEFTKRSSLAKPFSGPDGSVQAVRLPDGRIIIVEV